MSGSSNRLRSGYTKQGFQPLTASQFSVVVMTMAGHMTCQPILEDRNSSRRFKQTAGYNLSAMTAHLQASEGIKCL